MKWSIPNECWDLQFQSLSIRLSKVHSSTKFKTTQHIIKRLRLTYFSHQLDFLFFLTRKENVPIKHIKVRERKNILLWASIKNHHKLHSFNYFYSFFRKFRIINTVYFQSYLYSTFFQKWKYVYFLFDLNHAIKF